MRPSAYDLERLAYINSTMETIHDHADEIYESLVDREFDKLIPVIDELISELKEIKLSVTDEI